MPRYVVLLNFTEKGVAAAKDSVNRAGAFLSAAEKAGAKVEGLCWTLGPYDGFFILNAPDEATAAGVVLDAGKAGHIRTTMMRAFDEGEFKAVVAKMS